MNHTVGMIFAAGLGTRLKPFTLDNPKALVPVGGVPMLERVVRRMVRSGVNDIVINIHHYADKIRRFLKENNNLGANIVLSDESDLLLDTGGGILNARPLLEKADAVLVHNADVLTDVDLGAMLRNHERSKADVTLLVAKRETSRYLYFDRDNQRLRGWANIKTGETRPDGFMPTDNEPLAYAGVHVFSPRIFPALENYGNANPVFSIIPFYTANVDNLDIRGYVQKTEYTWLDVGKPDTLEIANLIIPYLENV